MILEKIENLTNELKSLKRQEKYEILHPKSYSNRPGTKNYKFYVNDVREKYRKMKKEIVLKLNDLKSKF
jgi:hypothetical protein